MKNIVFNVTFTAIFLSMFSLIIFTFSNTLISAFTSQQSLYSKDKSLEIHSCQKWTENVRHFNVKDGDEANRITVLTYNQIVNEEQLNEYELSEEVFLQSNLVLASEFEKQMAFLAKHHYTSLTAEEFYMFMQNEMKVPKNSILITIDGGFKSNVETAYPILKNYNFTAVNFIETGHITEKNNKSMQNLSINDLQKGCDVFDYQSHTYNFHQRDEKGEAYLVSASNKELKKDIAFSLVNLNKKSPIFAYPYGEYNDEITELLKQLNIKMAFTMEEKDVRPGMNLYKIPRKMVLPIDTIEDFKRKINMW